MIGQEYQALRFGQNGTDRWTRMKEIMDKLDEILLVLKTIHAQETSGGLELAPGAVVGEIIGQIVNTRLCNCEKKKKPYDSWFCPIHGYKSTF